MDLDQFFSWAGFVVALGVLATPALTAFKMLRAGTVGSMTITFFLFVFMNCANMTTYGIITSNLPLVLCNIYGICSATFAIRAYLALLQDRVVFHRQQRVVSSVMGEASPAREIEEEGGGGGKSPSPNRSGGGAVVTDEMTEQIAKNATAAELALDRTFKQTVIFCGADLGIIAIVLFLTLMKNGDLSKTLSGLAATTMGTIMFSGPLDQIGWILKHRSSAPLEPMIMIAAAANSICWGSYGLISRDPWLIIPNTCGLLLAMVQAVLLMWFPRNSAAGARQQDGMSAVDVAGVGAFGDTNSSPTVTVADLDRVIAATQAGATRPSVIST